MNKLPKYAVYKPSGVEWLGEIPEHWNLKKFKHFFISAMGETILASNLIDGGIYPVFSATEGFQYFGYINSPKIILDIGDIVIPARGNSIGFPKIVNEKSTCSQTTIYAKQISAINSNFVFFFLLGCKPYLFFFTQTAIPQITVDEVKNNYLILPPPFEQDSIATFLDHKTALIDKAIAIKEKQIELLKERRQILINKAVTRGLNPNVKRKDSGAKWIREVPEHWAVVRNYVLFQERNEPGNDTLPLLSVSIHTAVSSEELDDDENIRGKIKIQDKRSYKFVDKNDIVFNMMRAWQGAIGAVRVKGMVSPAYIVAKPKSEINADYFEYQYRTNNFIQQMDRNSKGITDFRKRLYWDEFKQLLSIVPTLPEQNQIAEFIESVNIKTTTVVNLKNLEIEKLKEYKVTLINSAVTGKIKVS